MSLRGVDRLHFPSPRTLATRPGSERPRAFLFPGLFRRTERDFTHRIPIVTRARIFGGARHGDGWWWWSGTSGKKKVFMFGSVSDRVDRIMHSPLHCFFLSSYSSLLFPSYHDTRCTVLRSEPVESTQPCSTIHIGPFSLASVQRDLLVIRALFERLRSGSMATGRDNSTLSILYQNNTSLSKSDLKTNTFRIPPNDTTEL